MRSRITAMGESVLVVGDECLTRVHIHTTYPDDVLSYACTVGRLGDIIIEDMDQQARDRNEKRERR